jgi:hypothetical protein
MEHAIELAAYYLWQHRLIHTHNSPESGLAAISLKIQKFAERVGEVTASRLKSGIRALRKVATEQIRQLMKTLAGAGYGAVQGEGAEMTYVPATGEQQLQLDLSPPPPAPAEFDTVDSPLMDPSIHETHVEQVSQASIDTIDHTNASSTASSERLDPRLEDKPNIAAIASEPIAKFLPQQHLECHQTPTPEPVAPDPAAPQALMAPPLSLKPGQKVEIWQEGHWLLATYRNPIDTRILSHQTHQLEQGHQVSMSSQDLLHVAISDMRPALDSRQPITSSVTQPPSIGIGTGTGNSSTVPQE